MKYILNIVLGLVCIGIFGMYFINFLGGTNVITEEKEIYILLIAALFYLLLSILFFIQIRKPVPLKFMVIIAILCIAVSIITIFTVGSVYTSLGVIGFVVSVASIGVTASYQENR